METVIAMGLLPALLAGALVVLLVAYVRLWTDSGITPCPAPGAKVETDWLRERLERWDRACGPFDRDELESLLTAAEHAQRTRATVHGLWACEKHPNRLWSGVHKPEDGPCCPEGCVGPGMQLADALPLLVPASPALRTVPPPMELALYVGCSLIGRGIGKGERATQIVVHLDGHDDQSAREWFLKAVRGRLNPGSLNPGNERVPPVLFVDEPRCKVGLRPVEAWPCAARFVLARGEGGRLRLISLEEAAGLRHMAYRQSMREMGNRCASNVVPFMKLPMKPPIKLAGHGTAVPDDHELGK